MKVKLVLKIENIEIAEYEYEFIVYNNINV